MPQNTVKKSNNQSKRIPHWLIAEVVGCAPGTVKAVRNGQRSNETNLGQQIMVAEILIQDKLINEVKKLVQFK
jgi:hypothetical protein